MAYRYFRLLAVIVFVALPVLGRAQTQTIRSPVSRVSLLELYTSEGCSSCPPAESWLSTLDSDPRLWRQIVPVSFHVDYWDNLGWRDPFDSHAYTERQRRLVSRAGGSVVYTPEFMLDAKEWHNFFNHRPLWLSTDVPNPGVLSLFIDDKKLTADFSPRTTLHANLALHVAVLAFGVTTKVNAGENAGRELEHDFLVISYQRSVMHQSNTKFSATLNIPATVKVHARRYALAAWVASDDNPEPLQAAGDWLAAAP